MADSFFPPKDEGCAAPRKPTPANIMGGKKLMIKLNTNVKAEFVNIS